MPQTTPAQAAPKKAPPTKAAIKKQGAKPPPPPLTPEELAAQQAKEAALKAKANAWQQDPKLSAQEKELGRYTVDKYGDNRKDPDLINRESKDPAVRDVVQLCKAKPKRALTTVQCVPGVNSTRVKVRQEVADYTLADQQAKRGKDFGLKIDYSKIVGWEGGSYTQGYIPWGLQLKTLEDNVGTKERAVLRQSVAVVTTRRTLDGKSVLQGDKAGGRSGTTIGGGVDLGQKDDAGYRKQFQNAAANKRFDYGAAEATALSDKLKPYMGLKLTDACIKLIKDPLTLTSTEVDFMNYESFMSHTDETIKGYKNATGNRLDELGKEEQTAIFSYVYNVGSMPSSLYKAFSKYDKTKVLAGFKGRREYAYVKKFYDDDVNSERAKARAAAVANPAAAAKAPPAATSAGKPTPPAARPTAAPASRDTAARTQPQARIQLGTAKPGAAAPRPATATPAAAPPATTPAAAPKVAASAPPAGASATAGAALAPAVSPAAATTAREHPYKQNEYRDQIKDHDQRGAATPLPRPASPSTRADTAAGPPLDAPAPLASHPVALRAKIQYPPVPRVLAAPAPPAPSRYPPPPRPAAAATTLAAPKPKPPTTSAPASPAPTASEARSPKIQYPASRPATAPATSQPSRPAPAPQPAHQGLSPLERQRQLQPPAATPDK